MEEIQTPSGETAVSIDQSIDVDALEKSIYEPSSERPMSEPEQKPVEQPHTPTQQEFILNVRGEQIKVPYNDPRVQQWLQQGRDYSQRMEQFNKERQEWEQKAKIAEQYQKTYGEIDEWARNNPDQWQLLQQTYQERLNQGLGQQQTQQTNDPYAQKMTHLEKEVGQMSQAMRELLKERQEALAKQEDLKLDQEIQSFREKYPKLDWQSPDEGGRSLEYQVLHHMKQHGLKNFGTAFKDLMHDQLVKLEVEKYKEAQAKEQQKRTRLGLLGEGPTPKKGISEVRDLKSKSWEDIHRETLEELGIA